MHLTDKEYKILELLTLHKHATLAKESFLNQLYGGVDEPDSEDHRCVYLQAAKETLQRIGR